LVAVIRNKPTLNNARDIFEAAVEMIGNRYSTSGTALTKNGLRTLVRLCLSGKQVMKNEEIDGIPLGTMEKDGIVFLNSATADLFQVIMPLVFATAFNRGMGIFDTNFVTYKPVVGFQALEKFARDFEVFENNLLVDLGIVETTFGEKFSGALMSPTLKNKKIKLTRMTAFNSKHEELPEHGTTIEVIESDKPLNMVKESACVWFGRGCAFDNLTSYPDQNKKKSLPSI